MATKNGHAIKSKSTTPEKVRQRIRKAIEAERQYPPLTKLRPLPEPRNDGKPEVVIGTPTELLRYALEAFKKLPPEEQECYRRRLRELLPDHPCEPKKPTETKS